MRLASPAILALALTSALPLAHAQQKLAPGLWETKMTVGDKDMQAAMAQARAQMANMPPEQRKMMEGMMAKQGVGLSGAGGIRFCLGKDQAERGDVPQDKDGRCTRTKLTTSGNTTSFEFSCSEPPSKGKGTITFASDKAYSMKMNVTSTMEGQTRSTEMTQNATWLGADCGDLKPRAAAGK